jgi:hypothetical protein
MPSPTLQGGAFARTLVLRVLSPRYEHTFRIHPRPRPVPCHWYKYCPLRPLSPSIDPTVRDPRLYSFSSRAPPTLSPCPLLRRWSAIEMNRVKYPSESIFNHSIFKVPRGSGSGLCSRRTFSALHRTASGRRSALSLCAWTPCASLSIFICTFIFAFIFIFKLYILATCLCAPWPRLPRPTRHRIRDRWRLLHSGSGRLYLSLSFTATSSSS